MENEEENLRKDFYKKLSWYFGEKQNLKGAIILVQDQLEKLNENLKKADESSTRLTKALNKLTLWGIIIAGGSLVVGLCSLIFEIIKYSNA